MEEYKIEENPIEAIKRMFYTNMVFEKHERDYGCKGADIILKNAQVVFQTIRDELLVSNQTNMLLVGRVQSGKTSNLEMITAIAFDNGYNSVIIYGGYDSVLLEQTTQRFVKAFDVSEGSKTYVFSTSDTNELLNIDNDIINTIIDEDKGKIIFVSMKRVGALSKINNVLTTVKSSELSTFIIDDEGDQASLNTEFRKLKASPTYNQIVQMKDMLSDPLYLSVTATPQALIFSPQLSRLRPHTARLIQPGSGYTGADSFHIKEGNIIRVNDGTDEIKNGKLPESLIEAIKYYLIASAIMFIRSINSSDMIVHCAKEQSIHVSLYTNIDNYFKNFKSNINNNNKDLLTRKNEYMSMFEDKSYFASDITSKLIFEDVWNNICKIVPKVYIVMQNSMGKETMSNLPLRKYKIFIGGDLLQRGITFKKLVTTYFTREPKTIGNMDTTLQRARWFGYRLEYLDLCKIFCTKSIAHKYSRLTEIDNDLWDQFESIQNREMSIDEIIVDENDTNLRPSRSNVTDIKTFSFKRKWFNQSMGVYNDIDISHNNKLFEDMISKLAFCKTSEGRTDTQTSAYFSEVDKSDFFNYVHKSKVIFSNHPFNKQILEKAFEEDKIILEIFWDPQKKDEGNRLRSFDDSMKISALQQGADTTDLIKRRYLGDSHVIVDPNAIIVQVFRIIPMIDGKNVLEKLQYMFSIHFPSSRKAYQWNK